MSVGDQEGELARLRQALSERDRLVAAQEAALAHGAKIFARSCEVAKVGVWECALPDERLTWTDGVYDIFELPRGTPVTRARAVRHYDPASLAELDRLRSRAIREQAGFTLDARITTARGAARWMRITATVESEGGVPVRIFGMKQDITEEKTLQDRTRFLAECDVLTGLSNRGRFQAALAAPIDSDAGGARALLLVDLDGFKDVNDTFGHAAGDACLVAIAERLRAACGAAALVARIGGDEFAVLLVGRDRAAVEDAAGDLGRRIVAAAREPIRHAGRSYEIGASVGIAVCAGPDGAPCADLQGEADLALYAAKAAGKDRVVRFDPTMRADGSARARTIAEVATAHDEGRLALAYQPIVDLRDGRVRGFEALLRRRRADGTLADAASFAAALRDPDLARRLDEWVLEAALTQAGRWRREGVNAGGLAVNMGAPTVCAPGFPERVLAGIAREGLPGGGDLTLEIAEEAFEARRDALAGPLARLREAGIRIALDDFGAGRTPLMEIGRLPIDAIKIDGALVRGAHDPRRRVALEALVHLARGYDLDLVAEGVETASERALVAAMGISSAQGWHFAHALPAERLVHGRDVDASSLCA
ncbi:putative bifunctional diguanylate cyclase/phosphodiesterase [Salinarimonas rosea]|uniref:putative bifunctional diguanylate cyclase/phosphodiesterase n=1 Tax=Salinarimonas rosea TaxID=552063 RepID=UPI0003FE7DE6|nr:EAL domain-containing protein [Salinarimonas rosea]